MRINIKIYLGILATVAFSLLLGNYLKKSKDYLLTNMQVILTAKVSKDDVFQFFYWEEGETKFKIKKSVKTKVKASTDFQEIKFTLPTINELNKIRLDIGENKNQEVIKIKKIKFQKENETLVFGIKSFNKLFKPNKYIKAHNEEEFSGIPGKSGKRKFYDPNFISNDDSTEINEIKTNKLTNYPYLISSFIGIVFFTFLFFKINDFKVTKEKIFSASFFILLFLPIIQDKIKLTPELDNLEKRKLATNPKFSFTKKFARDFEDYFDDNFGFRNNLVDIGGTIKTKLFKSSIHPDLVKLGKNKWIFYNSLNGRMFRSYSRTSLLSKQEIDKIVKGWQKNKENYEADGRKYFMAFWPNKNTIYRENLPYSMEFQIKDTISRVDQLIEGLKKPDVSVKLTDVRTKLFKSKSADKNLYYKFDSHWNSYGAFLAYQDFFLQNKDLGIKPKSQEDFNIEWRDYSGGELIQMLGVRNKGYFIEKKPFFTLKENKNQIEYLPIDGFPRLTVITKNRFSGNNLRALIFRDSFTNSLIPFFSLHFKEVYYIWGHHEKYVNQLKPDIIIDGFVEREMGDKTP